MCLDPMDLPDPAAHQRYSSESAPPSSKSESAKPPQAVHQRVFFCTPADLPLANLCPTQAALATLEGELLSVLQVSRQWLLLDRWVPESMKHGPNSSLSEGGTNNQLNPSGRWCHITTVIGPRDQGTERKCRQQSEVVLAVDSGLMEHESTARQAGQNLILQLSLSSRNSLAW